MLTALTRLLDVQGESAVGVSQSGVSPVPRMDASAGEILATFIEAAPDGIAIVDDAGTIAVANLQMHRLLDYQAGVLEGQSVEVLVPERLRAMHVHVRSGYQRSPHTRRMGSRLALMARRADGTELPVDIALGPITLGTRCMTLVFMRDATDQQALWDQLAAAKASLETELGERRQYRALTELLQTLRSRDEIRSVLSLHMEHIFPQTNGALALLDPSGGLAETLVSWGSEPLPDAFPIDACLALRLGRVHESGGDAACQHGACEGRYALCVPLMADGETLGVFHLQPEPRHDVAGPSLTADERRRASDIAERLALPIANIQLRDRLLNQSVRDPLTGVHNRRHMDEVMAREISRAARLDYSLTVAMLDLDYYKRFNDTFGHDAGDQLLRTFAQFLASHIRVDDTVFRYGGEEFVLMLPGAHMEAARPRIEGLRDAWRAHAESCGWTVTFSAGLAESPSHGSSPQEILRAADGALYEAKASGRDRVTVAGLTRI